MFSYTIFLFVFILTFMFILLYFIFNFIFINFFVDGSIDNNQSEVGKEVVEITLNNILSKNDNEILSPGKTDALNTLKNEVVFGAEKEVEKEVEGRRRMSWPFGMFFAPVLLDGTLACDAGKYVRNF